MDLDDRFSGISIEELQLRIMASLATIVRHAGSDEAHHLKWVIDQVTRTLAGEGYEKIVSLARHGQDGPETYDWDVGIPP